MNEDSRLSVCRFSLSYDYLRKSTRIILPSVLLPRRANSLSIHGKNFPAAGRKSLSSPSTGMGSHAHAKSQYFENQYFTKNILTFPSLPVLPARALPYTLWFFIGYWI
jgi:hypothetical protein